MDRHANQIRSLVRHAHRRARQQADYAGLKAIALAVMVALGASIGTFCAVDRLIQTATAEPTKSASDKSKSPEVANRALHHSPIQTDEQRFLIALLSSVLTLMVGGLAGALVAASYRRRVPRDEGIMAGRLSTYLQEHEGAVFIYDYPSLFRPDSCIPPRYRSAMVQRWRIRHLQDYPGAAFMSEGPGEIVVFLGSLVSLVAASLIIVIFHGSTLTQDVTAALTSLDLDMSLTGALLLLVAVVAAVTIVPFALLVIAAAFQRSDRTGRLRFKFVISNINASSPTATPETTSNAGRHGISIDPISLLRSSALTIFFRVRVRVYQLGGEPKMNGQSNKTLMWLLLVPCAVAVLAAASLLGGAKPQTKRDDALDHITERGKGDFDSIAQDASPSVKRAYDLALTAHMGENSLIEAVDARTAMTLDSNNEADQRLGPRIDEILFEAAQMQTVAAQKDGKTVSPKTKDAVQVLAEQQENPQARTLIKGAVIDAKNEPTPAQEIRAAAGNVLVDPNNMPNSLPSPDPDLQASANEGENLANAIKDNISKGKEIKDLLVDFDQKYNVFQGKLSKAMAGGAKDVDKLLGPALGWAKAVGTIAPLVSNWKNLSDAQKIGGVASSLGSVLEAMQPYLTVAFAKKKMVAVLALKIVSTIIPNVNIADVNFGGPKLGGGNSNKKTDSGKKKDESSKKPASSGKVDSGQKPSKPTKLSNEEQGEKAKLVEQAKEEIKRSAGVPANASGKVDPQKAKEAAVKAVSHGSVQIETIVRLKLQYLGDEASIDRIADMAAYEAVMAGRKPVANKVDDEKR